MKRKLIPGIAILVILLAAYLVGTGLMKNSSAFIESDTVSPDGREITLTFGSSSSVGYIRGASVHRQEGGELRLDCRSAFGGLNGRIGAGGVCTFPLNEDTTKISLYAGAGQYRTVLEKDADGTWSRVTNQ